jgi:hypothetical protein
MIDYNKLALLSKKLQNGTATKKEKDEYMLILYQNGSMPKKQYDNYIAEKNTEDILNAALTIGAIVLFGLLVKRAVAA